MYFVSNRFHSALRTNPRRDALFVDAKKFKVPTTLKSPIVQ